MTRRNPFEPREGALSLYVHVPFCASKCPYCAFESTVPRRGEVELWLRLLQKELDWWTNRIGRPLLDTCYIGGGTPTVLDLSVWRELISAIESRFDFKDDAEVTVEANPNSLERPYLAMWREWRVTRVSIGVQSFDDAALAKIGRIHSAEEARFAVKSALDFGFSVNADLMFALPNQTFRDWALNMREAVSLGVRHISLYQLSIEPGSAWAKMSADSLPEGADMYRWAQRYMPSKGFAQYEIANFSLSGHQSRHNINYWREGEYLGAGPGAAGYLAGWRYKNSGSLKEYGRLIDGGRCAAVSGERLTDAALAREASVLALRMAEGIDIAEYESRYGAEARESVCRVLRGFPQDLYEITDKNIRLTAKGMRIANLIWQELV